MTRGADMEAAILAGGLGTRLRGVVDDRPKPMAEVAGRPFIEWLVLYLRSLGVGRMVLCTGHMSESVEGHFGDGRRFGVAIRHSRETIPLGTAGAVRLALDVLGSERFLVLNGDSLCPFNPGALLMAHRRGAMATLWLVEAADGGRFGSVRMAADGTVTAFKEKDPAGGPGLINAGIYLLERSLIASLPNGVKLSLETDVLPGLPPGALRGVAGPGPFIDIGTPADYRAASEFVRANIAPLAAGERR